MLTVSEMNTPYPVGGVSITNQLLTCSKEERRAAANLLINHPDTDFIFEEKVRDMVSRILRDLNLVSKEEVKSIVDDELDSSFDTRLADSQLRPIKRILAVEVITGIKEDPDITDEERKPNIQDNINELEERIDQIQASGKVIVPAIQDSKNTIIDADEKYGYCAVTILEDLNSKKTTRLSNYTERIFETKDFHRIMETIPDEFRPSESNDRTAKRCIYRIASRCNGVRMEKSKYGNKDWLLIMSNDFDSSILKCNMREDKDFDSNRHKCNIGED